MTWLCQLSWSNQHKIVQGLSPLWRHNMQVVLLCNQLASPPLKISILLRCQPALLIRISTGTPESSRLAAAARTLSRLARSSCRVSILAPGTADLRQKNGNVSHRQVCRQPCCGLRSPRSRSRWHGAAPYSYAVCCSPDAACSSSSLVIIPTGDCDSVTLAAEALGGLKSNACNEWP